MPGARAGEDPDGFTAAPPAREDPDGFTAAPPAREDPDGFTAAPPAREDPDGFTAAPPAREDPDGFTGTLPIPAPAGQIVRVLTLYTKPDCHLCEEALEELRGLQEELSFALELRDITAEEALHRMYFERIPVGALDGEELFEYFVDAEVLRERLQSGP